MTFRPFLIAFIFTALTVVPMANAQQTTGGSIMISPLLIELSLLESGKSYDEEIIVKNTYEVPYTITLEALDVEINSDNHAVQFLPPESKGNTEKSLASWVKPSGPTSFVLEPGQEQVFMFTVNLPAGLSSGDYFASLNFYYEPQGAGADNGRVQVRQSLGSLLLVSLGGDGQAVVDTNDYTITGPRVSLLGSNVQVLADVTNNTLRYIHLKPQLTVVNREGEVVYRRDGKAKRVFPGEVATLTDTFPKSIVSLEEGLTLKYVLLDARSQLKYYEASVSLDDLSASWLSVIRQWFVGAIVVLILISLTVLVIRRERNKK